MINFARRLQNTCLLRGWDNVTMNALLCAKMCTVRLTEQIYPKVQSQFLKNPSLEKMSKYMSPENLLQIFDLVKQTPMSFEQRMQNFDQIEQRLCTQNGDREFNILANIYLQKSRMHLSTGNSGQVSALVEAEKAVQAIESMDQPYHLEIAMINKNAGTIHLGAGLFDKAERYYQSSLHSMRLEQQEMSQEYRQNPGSKQYKEKQIVMKLFRINLHNQFSNLYSSTGDLTKLSEHVTSALGLWKQVGDRDTIHYLLTIQHQCILYLRRKQKGKAAELARWYLSKYAKNEQTSMHRLWFYKILASVSAAQAERDQYEQKLKQEIEDMSKIMSPQQLNSSLIMLGIIKRPTDPKQQQ